MHRVERPAVILCDSGHLGSLGCACPVPLARGCLPGTNCLVTVPQDRALTKFRRVLPALLRSKSRCFTSDRLHDTWHCVAYVAFESVFGHVA